MPVPDLQFFKGRTSPVAAGRLVRYFIYIDSSSRSLLFFVEYLTFKASRVSLSF